MEANMSRTDVHAPYWVKSRDPLWRNHFTEHHDHSTGPCDLGADERPGYVLGWGTVGHGRCYITATFNGANIHCGCRQCTGHHGRRWANGQQRAQWRAIRQRVLAAVDRDDVDVPPPTRGDAW